MKQKSPPGMAGMATAGEGLLLRSRGNCKTKGRPLWIGTRSPFPCVRSARQMQLPARHEELAASPGAQPASAPPAPSVPDAALGVHRPAPVVCSQHLRPSRCSYGRGKNKHLSGCLPTASRLDSQQKVREKQSSARSAPNASELSYPRSTLAPASAAPSRFLKLRGGVEVVSSYCINKVYELEIPPARFISRALVHANQAMGGG